MKTTSENLFESLQTDTIAVSCNNPAPHHFVPSFYSLSRFSGSYLRKEVEKITKGMDHYDPQLTKKCFKTQKEMEVKQ